MSKIYEISESDREEILSLIRSRSYLGAKNSLMQLQESKQLLSIFVKAFKDVEKKPLTFDQKWSELKKIIDEMTK